MNSVIIWREYGGSYSENPTRMEMRAFVAKPVGAISVTWAGSAITKAKTPRRVKVEK